MRSLSLFLLALLLTPLFVAEAHPEEMGDTEVDQKLYRAARHCDSGAAGWAQEALAAGANIKATPEFEHALVDQAAFNAAQYPHSACLEVLKLLLEHGADPNAWIPDTTPLGRVQDMKRANVTEVLVKAGALDFKKVVPDCEAAKAKLSDPNRFFRAYSRYLLRERCKEPVLGGVRFIGADVARVRAAPSASAPILRLGRINTWVVITEEQVDTWTRLDATMSPLRGWIATEVLRTSPTSVEEARASLEKAIQGNEPAQSVTWANRLRLLSPDEPADLQRVMAGYEAAKDTTKAAALAEVMRGDATVYLAMCAFRGAPVLATYSRAAGLKPLSNLKGLGQWVGTATWFGVLLPPGPAPGATERIRARAIHETSSNYEEERPVFYDEERVTHAEQVWLERACDRSPGAAPIALATAPFVRVEQSVALASDGKAETIDLLLGETTHRISFEAVEKGRGRKKTRSIRVSHMAEKGRAVQRVIEERMPL